MGKESERATSRATHTRKRARIFSGLSGLTRTRKQSWIFSALYGLVAAWEWGIFGCDGWRAVIPAGFTLIAIAYLVSALRWRSGASRDDDEASPAGA